MNAIPDQSAIKLGVQFEFLLSPNRILVSHSLLLILQIIANADDGRIQDFPCYKFHQPTISNLNDPRDRCVDRADIENLSQADRDGTVVDLSAN